jgi:PEP-CTERM motif
MGWYKNRIAAAALGVFALGIACSESAAGGVGPPPSNPITFTVDENCHGTSSSGGVTTSLPCALLPDPLPGGLPSAMTYSLLGAPVIPGTLILLEPTGGVSDVIRFFGAAALGPLAAVGSELVFYSDNADGADALADVGFPTQNFGNVVTFTEVGSEGNNGFTYIPSLGQPGSVVGGGPPTTVTYVIVSDSVPEPATLALLGIGLAGLGLWRRLRKQ